MLEENPDIRRGGDPKLHDVTLADLGVSKIQSHRWQQVAAVPGERFEDYLEAIAASGELTTVGVLRQHKSDTDLHAVSRERLLPDGISHIQAHRWPRAIQAR